MSALYRAEVAVFEHGMDDTRDRVLCSVDHAHIHFVPLPRTFDAGNTARDPEWIEFDGQLATLDRLSDGGEYVFYEAPDGVCRLLASRHRKLESQYMRRIIAEGLGRAQHWNWREAPDARTADQTWRRFRGRQ